MPFLVAPEVPACPGAWPWAPGRGLEEERMAEQSRSPELTPEGDFWHQMAPGMTWALDPTAKGCGCSFPPSPEPGTGVREQPAQGWGPRNKLPVPHVAGLGL